jgi:AbrB family looped-hinge helix DNA binding protein
MATLKVHGEGWIAVPSGLRQQLGLSSGDRLEAHLVDGAIVLRRVTKTRGPRQPDQAIEAAAAEVPTTAATTAMPAKRKRGRPRKVVVDPTDGPVVPAPETKRPRGRPRETTAAVAPAPEPEPAPVPAVASEPWKLRKKADLQPAAAPDPDQPPPRARPQPALARSDSGYQREERRPFRHVEVRKLGPGRGHNRPGRLFPGPGAAIRSS